MASPPRSTYCCALAHSRKPTGSELRARAAEIFGRLPDGVGHRQAAMGLRCDGRRGTDRRCYGSYRSAAGEVLENVSGCDFSADGPWRRVGAGVAESKRSLGKAHLAPVHGFGSKKIAARSVSESLSLSRQEEIPSMLVAAKSEGANSVLYSDMAGGAGTASTCPGPGRTASPRACRARAAVSTTARPSGSSAA